MNKTFARNLLAASLIGGAAIGLSGVAHAETYGDPDGMAGWQIAQAYNDCAIMAAADVIGQMTGNEPAEDEIVNYAANTRSVSRPSDMIFRFDKFDGDPDGGTVFADLPVVLGHYGVSSKFIENASLGSIEQALANGGAVIVNLNAELIWDSEGDRTESDHALVVTGVDTDNGIVHLNDSGGDDGADEQVSIKTFKASWATSGNEMVVAT